MTAEKKRVGGGRKRGTWQKMVQKTTHEAKLYLVDFKNELMLKTATGLLDNTIVIK